MVTSPSRSASNRLCQAMRVGGGLGNLALQSNAKSYWVPKSKLAQAFVEVMKEFDLPHELWGRMHVRSMRISYPQGKVRVVVSVADHAGIRCSIKLTIT